MKKAFIVLAHKNPLQLQRLIQSLDDENSTFFVHLDKKADASAFKTIWQSSTHVASVKSVATYWADFSLVEATLNGIKAVMEYPRQFDFVTLISGQHYPVRSNPDIDNFLRNTCHRTFLEYTKIPNYVRWKVRGGLYRLDKYFLGMRYYQRMAAKTANFITTYTRYFRRRFPENMTPYAGSQWWTMDNYTLTYVQNFVKNNPGYLAYHKHMFAPDELFFHNILLNANDDTVLSGITNNNLLFMNWPVQNTAHPEILTMENFESMMQSDALFARKFDMDSHARVLDAIDESRTGETLPSLM